MSPPDPRTLQILCNKALTYHISTIRRSTSTRASHLQTQKRCRAIHPEAALELGQTSDHEGLRLDGDCLLRAPRSLLGSAPPGGRCAQATYGRARECARRGRPTAAVLRPQPCAPLDALHAPIATHTKLRLCGRAIGGGRRYAAAARPPLAPAAAAARPNGPPLRVARPTPSAPPRPIRRRGLAQTRPRLVQGPRQAGPPRVPSLLRPAAARAKRSLCRPPRPPPRRRAAARSARRPRAVFPAAPGAILCR